MNIKKILPFIAGIFLLSTTAISTETTIVPEKLNMTRNDAKQVEFCIYDNDIPVDANVLINPICRDKNEMLGCNAGDIFDPAGFTVTAINSTTGADGCAILTVKTDLEDDDEIKKFYFTVNGKIADAIIGAETVEAKVPEMSPVATTALFVGLSLLIASGKRLHQ